MSTELIAIIGVGIALAGLMLNGQHNLQNEMHAQRAETRAEFQTQSAETRAEFQTQRAETQAEFKAIREETQAEFQAVREEAQAQREIITGLLERMARLEGLIDGLRAAIVGRRAADTETAKSGQS